MASIFVLEGALEVKKAESSQLDEVSIIGPLLRSVFGGLLAFFKMPLRKKMVENV